MNQENIHSNASSDSDEISLKELILKIQDWWRYLLSKWLTILVCGLVGGALGFYYAYTRSAIYTATTTFVLEEEKGGGGLASLSGLASVAGLDISSGGGIFQGDNILELYKSKSIIKKTLLTQVEYNGEKELLIDHYVAFNKLKESWIKDGRLQGLTFEIVNKKKNKPTEVRLRDSIIGSIVADIKKSYLYVIKPDKSLSIIKAEIKAPDEFFAKEFNTQLVANVNEFYIQTKIKKSLGNIDILQRKVDSVQSVLRGAIYTSAKVADATPNLNPTRQIQRNVPIQRSQITAEINKTVLAELIRNLELSKIALQKETPLIQVIDEPSFPLDKSKMGKLIGLVLGGIIAGFITCVVLTVKRIFRNIIA